jgi:hypothetical protein
MNFGFKGGLGYSVYAAKSNIGTSLDTAYKMGYLVGPGLDLGVGPISIEGDLLYAHRSYGYDVGNTQVSVSRIEVPVAAKFSFGLLNVQGGLYYAMGLGKIATKIAGVSQPSEGFGTAGYERSDFGMLGGLGVTIPAGLVSVGLDLRYMFGLTDQNTSPGSARHRSFDILASVWF